MATLGGSWQDREAVRELYARYSLTLDNGDFTSWLDCFTASGVLESPRFGRHEGREGLRRFIDLYQTALGGARVLHFNSNLSFVLDGDSGSGTCYFAYFYSRQGSATIGALGHYVDKLSGLDGVWRFEQRRVFLDAHS